MGVFLDSQPCRTFGFKASRATFGRARGLWQIENPVLKSGHKISQAHRPKIEAVIRKGPRSDPLANLGGPPRDTGSN